MKRVKLFEEFTIEDDILLEQFCKENLAYLIDEGYSFTLDYANDDYYDDVTEISIFKNNMRGVTPFNLSEIIYDFIPFLLLLNKEWDLVPYAIYFRHEDDDYNYQSIDGLIYQHDNNIDIEEIRFIKIMIKGMRE